MATVTDLLHEILDYAWDYYDDMADRLELQHSQHPIVKTEIERLREKANAAMELRDNVDYFDGHLTEEENNTMHDAVSLFMEYCERELYNEYASENDKKSSRAYLKLLKEQFE